LRITHDFISQRSTPGRDYLNNRLHSTPTFSRKLVILQRLFEEIPRTVTR
jgi:hypothetical protein